MSNQHAWITDVMQDLSKYAHLNCLHETGKHIERAISALEIEAKLETPFEERRAEADNVLSFSPSK